MNISQWWYIHSYIPLSMSPDVDAYDQIWMRPLYLGHTDFRSVINRCVQDLNTFLWGGWKKGCESILKEERLNLINLGYYIWRAQHTVTHKSNDVGVDVMCYERRRQPPSMIWKCEPSLLLRVADYWAVIVDCWLRAQVLLLLFVGLFCTWKYFSFSIALALWIVIPGSMARFSFYL